MLIEQITEFELRRAGPSGCTSTPTTGYFQDIAKTVKANLRLDYYLLLKYYPRQCTLLPPTWAKSLTKLIPKCKILKRVLYLNCK